MPRTEPGLFRLGTNIYQLLRDNQNEYYSDIICRCFLRNISVETDEELVILADQILEE